MKLGEVKYQKVTCINRYCDECGESATKRITFLLEDARRNLASSAYGKDDCSWCSDAEAFACDEHEKEVKRNHVPRDMDYCSTFTRGERFEHMFLRMKTEDVKPEVMAEDFLRQLNAEVSKDN